MMLPGFFTPIKDPKLKAVVLKIKVQEAKIINQLKEDKHSFTLLAEKEVSHK